MRAEAEREYADYVRARVVALRRTAYRLCGDWHRADDLVQDTLVLLYRHWRRVNDTGTPDAYVHRMLVNAFLADQRRWWARRVSPVADLPATGRTPGAGELADGRLDLMSALARVTPTQRAVLVLRYWEGLDVNDTARVLGCAPGTVKSRTAAAVAALRRLLPDYVGTSAGRLP